ncbi:MAG: cell division protein CrgA [Acidimicrobiales bacterium]
MATKAKSGPGKASKKGSSRGRTVSQAEREPKRSDRYTPPIPKKVKVSPRWMGPLIIALFLLGVVIIILNYAGVLPGGVDNWWLVGAIGAIFVGLMVATRYR